MLEGIEMLGSGVAALLAYGAGVISGRRRPTAEKPPRPPDLVCGCEHELAMHDPQTNKCHDQSDDYAYDPRMKRSVQLPCPCRQYTGPKPIDQVFQPRFILPPEES